LNIAFRVDATDTIGIGHFMRCLALSEELNKRGYSCFFVTKINIDFLISKIKKENIFFQLNPNLNLKEDVKELINYSNKKNIDWIITDHYGLNKEYIAYLKKNNFKVLSIDDISKIHYFSDIVLNQNIESEKLNYSSEKYTQFLLGPKYAILRDRLLIRNDKKFNLKVKNILIILGGTDKNNLTLKLIELLFPISKQIKITVIIGPLHRNYNEIIKYVNDKNINIDIKKSPENIEEVYLNSDIALSAGGITCYELAYFGIPNIIITIAENQIKSAKGLDNKSVSLYLGSESIVDMNYVKKKIDELINNDKLRKTMSNNGKKLVDGRGKIRIINVMESYS